MKKRYILFEFLLIFIFLVLPPLFVTKAEGLSKAGHFSPFVIIQFFIALVLQLQFKFIFIGNKHPNKNIIFKGAFWWSITLGCLMLIFALMQSLELLFEKDALTRNQLPAIKSLTSWFFLVLSVTVAAFYEEVIYRQTIPELSKVILGAKSENIWTSRLMEILWIGIFAFSHRYLGWIPVANAFACGLILRICYKKTESVWTGAAAHFVYNMTLITFSILS